MLGQTLREISTEYAQKQPHQVEYLLAGTPLLDRMPFVPSTHGLQHVFERISEIGEGTFVKVDQALPEADVSAELDRINLGVFGFRITAGIDKVAAIAGKGNFAGYLARKAPKIMTKSGMRFETDYAKLLKRYAIENGNVVNAGGTGSDCHTIFVVRFIEDEVCGLYDENGFGSGALFDTIPLSGGNPYTDKDGVTVYGADFKTYCGFMIENPHAVAIVTNITKDKPLTQAMLDEACLLADVDGLGTAYIVGSGKSNQFINALKDPHYTQSESYSTRIKDWNGTEIINDSNFPKGEDAVNIDTEKNFRSLFGAINAMAEKYDMPVLYSCHPRSRHRLEASGFRLDPRVRVQQPLGFHDYNCLQMYSFCTVSDSGTLPEESSFYASVGRPISAVCIRTSTERPEALDKGCFVLSGIDTKGLLQSVELAVRMTADGYSGIPVPDYTDDVSGKVIRIIQSYVGVVNKMVWRKEI